MNLHDVRVTPEDPSGRISVRANWVQGSLSGDVQAWADIDQDWRLSKVGYDMGCSVQDHQSLTQQILDAIAALPEVQAAFAEEDREETVNSKILSLPEGILGRVIQEAHKLAQLSLGEDWGGSSQYASYSVLYYDEKTWLAAYKNATGEDLTWG